MTSREKAERLHKKVNTFFLSCVGADGYPMTKAVVPGILEFYERLGFAVTKVKK